jgi:hypothetical protein
MWLMRNASDKAVPVVPPCADACVQRRLLLLDVTGGTAHVRNSQQCSDGRDGDGGSHGVSRASAHSTNPHGVASVRGNDNNHNVWCVMAHEWRWLRAVAAPATMRRRAGARVKHLTRGLSVAGDGLCPAASVRPPLRAHHMAHALG